ncbi:hypothetical protein GpartN1_g5025.t1 [Galdieria partita]|uniref:SOUL heme-binding protein n=1 Tax=Galdieria partita TaxID=83374 RepID=A0A9C7PZW6_9RHOD|nr:hypothetical protein GpartN1_g5025.t1 [Galdieria partita]
MGSVLGKVSVEQPLYEIERKTSEYEIRKYPSLRLAEVSRAELKNETSGYDFESQAFRILASYIGVFGEPKNKDNSNQQVKISMTAPVLSKPIETLERQSGSMAFILPKEYSEQLEPPEPVDSRVHLRLVPPRTVAVITFRGAVNRETLESDRAKKFMEQLKKDGYRLVSSDWELARYNPPFTPPPLRRNEILVQVE